MNSEFGAAMRRAMASIRGLDVPEATRIIQEALLGGDGPAGPDAPLPESNPAAPAARRAPPASPIDRDAEPIEPVEAASPVPGTARPGTPDPTPPARPERSGRALRLRRPLGEALRLIRQAQSATDILEPAADAEAEAPPPEPPAGARFVARTHGGPAGSRAFKVYLPAGVARPRGLVVMLHGCKQNPDDFATGTAMNRIAEAHGLAVAYPHQPKSANAQACWNWFNPGDQRRDAGEPAILAGITRELMAEFELERDRVFVAGLSAGGAMAAVMAEAYPDLFAAVGIHSGLATGSADDVISAFAAMRGEFGRARSGRRSNGGAVVRTIVFHGTADRTVHPANAERIVAAARAAGPAGTREERGRAPGGRSFTRLAIDAADGGTVLEYWLVEGAGHAWSGGHPSGSHTDPTGPDASGEMVRFFLGRG